MLNCNQPNCKKHKTCNLKKPITRYTNEIQYWLTQLKAAQKRITEYYQIREDIHYHKYSTPVNVYGKIQYAPKMNVFGVYIRRPEHVNYGWNINRLEKQVEKITEEIRSLRLKEYRESELL